MIRQEEDIHMLSADRKNNKLVNLYEVSNKTQELATAYLRKKGKFIDESPKIHSGEFQKRSSVYLYIYTIYLYIIWFSSVSLKFLNC